MYFEIFVFIVDWVFSEGPVRNVRRSVIGFLINQAEIVLCFAVMFKTKCGMSGYADALYNSLRTAVTIGPASTDGCRGLIATEIVVAYVLTVVVIASSVGGIARGER